MGREGKDPSSPFLSNLAECKVGLSAFPSPVVLGEGQR